MSEPRFVLLWNDQVNQELSESELSQLDPGISSAKFAEDPEAGESKAKAAEAVGDLAPVRLSPGMAG
jgi:hypothetical protein